MLHKMNLWNDSFQKIKDGTKTIEMRLFDKKRSSISVGDTIEFTNTKTGEKIQCVVVNLYKYKNFGQLYKNHDKMSIGYLENEIANPSDMLAYYSAQKIEHYGVVGIEVKTKQMSNRNNIQAKVFCQQTKKIQQKTACNAAIAKQAVFYFKFCSSFRKNPTCYAFHSYLSKTFSPS